MATKKQHNTKLLCTVAMLIAITVILGALSIRIGSGIKISLKFIPVVLCSAMFGPWWGGLCGGLSDFLSYLLNPAGGAYLFPISIVEFLYGVSYGLFFYNAKDSGKSLIFRISLCLVINTLFFSMGAMAFILKNLMGMTFFQTIVYRLPSTIANTIIHFAGMIIILKYLPVFNGAKKQSA